MVDEPLVIVVKLADRLHNMRTVYALRPDRQRAVATETLQLWCSLAERLGMFALKASFADFWTAMPTSLGHFTWSRLVEERIPFSSNCHCQGQPL